ncbi:hypothetical protein Tco_0610772 [Tanacetum coccineum]
MSAFGDSSFHNNNGRRMMAPEMEDYYSWEGLKNSNVDICRAFLKLCVVEDPIWEKITYELQEPFHNIYVDECVCHIGERGKLNPRYVGLFKVIKRVRTVAYKLELSQKLSRFHNTFHVSNLKKCLSDESLVIPLEELRVDDKFHFVEEAVEVMDRKIKQLKRSRIHIIKVRWTLENRSSLTGNESIIQAKYPHLSYQRPHSRQVPRLKP